MAGRQAREAGLDDESVESLHVTLRRRRGGDRIAPSCTQALARFRGFITHQPASRYWAFQSIETGIFVVLAAILLTVTAVVLIRRDA